MLANKICLVLLSFVYCFLFYSALFWCCFLSPFSNVKKEKDLSVILMLCMKCRQCMFLACPVKVPWITLWLYSLPTWGPRWLLWQYRQEWKVLFSWTGKTMLARALPPQWGVLWCDTEPWKDHTGGTSLQVKPRLGAVQTGMAAVRALRALGTRWDMHPLLFISAVRSASE